MTPTAPTFLDGLSPAARDAVLGAGQLRSWAAGAVVIREGDPATTALVITVGLVKIHKYGAQGDELILGLCGPGDLLGEVSVVPKARRSADVTALEDMQVISIGVAELRRVLVAHPELSLALLELVLARLRQADVRRLESATAESLGRVSSRLLELAERFGVPGDAGQIDVPMPINQEELASWAGASRESTARALRTLRELGLIETQRRRLVVKDVARLSLHAPG